MKIMLDPGHGGSDPGACHGGRLEKTDALKMALRVGQLLAGEGAQVDYTRTLDVYDSPMTKARKGNRAGADLFVSFHRNSASSAQGNGFETLVYADEGMAKAVADAANMRMAEIGFRHRGTKIRKELAVLNGTRMAAVLFEIGFISHEGDNALFDSRFEEIARGLKEAILTAFGRTSDDAPAPSKNPQTQPAPRPHMDVRYQVYAGKWYPNVLNTSDYAGVKGKVITGIRGNTVGKAEDVGHLLYRAHLLGGGWLPWVRDREDYAGITGKSIDGVQMKLAGAPSGREARYRVSTVGADYLPWVTGDADYAGLYGKAIDRLQVEII